jgi:hypothetical protein
MVFPPVDLAAEETIGQAYSLQAQSRLSTTHTLRHFKFASERRNSE